MTGLDLPRTIGPGVPGMSSTLTGPLSLGPAPLGPPAPAPSPQTAAGSAPAAGGLEGAGLAIGIAGALTQAVGSFYAAKSAKLEAKSQALALDFRSQVAMVEARAAEEQAQAIFVANRREQAVMGQRAAETRERARAAIAARGGTLGVGSAGEVVASIDYESKLAAFTVSANAVRAAAAARMRAQGARTESVFAGVSARNVARSGQSIRPWLSVGTSAAGSAATIIRAWPRDVQQ